MFTIFNFPYFNRVLEVYYDAETEYFSKGLLYIETIKKTQIF